MIFDKWIAAFAHEKLTCGACKNEFSVKELRKANYICPNCGKYMRIGGRERINQVVDKKSFEEFATGLSSVDFLEFPGYADKLTKAIDTTGEDDAVICGHATVGGHPCAIFVMDSRFMMASMGSVVGEKITRTFEYATKHNLPVIGFTASGGARMQEGIISLMQMAKCSAAVKKHSTEGNLYYGTDGSDHRRCNRFLRNAGRHYPCGAECVGWICRTPCGGADHQVSASG